VVQVVRGHYFILDARVEEVHHILRSLTLEDIQVLYNELLLLGPPDPQALLMSLRGLLLVSVIETIQVKQVIHALIVNLEEGHEH
jgi:hypothetical protein